MNPESVIQHALAALPEVRQVRLSDKIAVPAANADKSPFTHLFCHYCNATCYVAYGRFAFSQVVSRKDSSPVLRPPPYPVPVMPESAPALIMLSGLDTLAQIGPLENGVLDVRAAYGRFMDKLRRLESDQVLDPRDDAAALAADALAAPPARIPPQALPAFLRAATELVTKLEASHAPTP